MPVALPRTRWGREPEALPPGGRRRAHGLAKQPETLLSSQANAWKSVRRLEAASTGGSVLSRYQGVNGTVRRAELRSRTPGKQLICSPGHKPLRLCTLLGAITWPAILRWKLENCEHDARLAMSQRFLKK
jgi:hypothetical protein